MKTTRTFVLIATVFSVGLTAAWWCSAQSSTPAKKPVTGDSNPALDRLTALVSYLEASKQTNALKLFNEYSSTSIALQHAADMGATLHILKALREGRTTNAIELLEGRLDTDIIGLAASFKEMPEAQQEWLGLHSLSEARWYRDKYPHKHRYQNVDDGVAQAFELLPKKSEK
ncbi:MAG: hypothetical protein JWQ71_3376 [Pedosphaera sp.]|nr:hypothetical protein [Pedosphaera sp.]